MKKLWQEEQRLIWALLALVVLLNVPYGRYVLYPLTLFATWIHESCHGLAALLLGGSIDKIQIFPDGSGLATTLRPTGPFSTAWVASAGYVGTSVIGALMLVFRRKRLAGRIGLTALGLLMVASVVLIIRNAFGMAAVAGIGGALLAVGWITREALSGWVYTFVAATACLNGITSIQILFSASLMVNGQAVGGSDATTVADALFLPYWFWAGLWIVFGLGLMIWALRHPAGLKASSKSA